MKAFFNKMMGYKTKRVPKLDCRDFELKCPERPSYYEVKAVISQQQHAQHMQQQQGKKSSNTNPGLLKQQEAQQEIALRSMTFDLMYRCAGAGRCIHKDYACRYPCCFGMRPVSKGAEVFSERLAFEIDDPPVVGAKRIVDMCREERIEEAEVELEKLVNLNIKKRAAASGGKFTEANILSLDQDARYEAMPLLLWRAALLVNMGQDDRAVAYLLSAARQMPAADREDLYSAATGWAALNDMEIIYYRSLLGTHEPFPIAELMARNRPLLLRKVVHAAGNEDDRGRMNALIATVVLGKELGATAAKGQAVQMHGDETEDPMKSFTIPLALTYYRFNISADFWREFLSLLVLPVMPPPVREDPSGAQKDNRKESTPVNEQGETTVTLQDAMKYVPTIEEANTGAAPPFVLDANYRIILMHHLLSLERTRQKELYNGSIKLPSNLASLPEEERSKYSLYLEPQQYQVVERRLKELLMISRHYDMSLKRVMEESGAAMEAEGGKP